MTRPDTFFTDGVCSACISHAARPKIDWASRKRELEALLDRHHGRVIVPSSGGKDSTYQALTLKAMGADVTAVTATTCHLTAIGRRNIDNLARHVRTIEVTPRRDVRWKLNRTGLTMVGDISWPEHVAIFTTPFKMAVALGIPLIMYGENPQNQYGGPPGTTDARQMTRRWVSEFGGFLGLRPSDLIGDQFTERDLEDYMPPSDAEIKQFDVEAHFLGQYLPWDSHRNAEVSVASGFNCALPSQANWWDSENLDNAQTGIHDHFMYRKYGMGRLCQQISVDIREKRIKREKALEICNERDGAFPESYAGVSIGDVLDRLGLCRDRFDQLADEFTNWDLFGPATVEGRPIQKEEWETAKST